MYDELVKALRETDFGDVCVLCESELCRGKDCVIIQAADAIEELQATLCNWCAVCPEDKRDLSTCEIYESCHAEPPKEETCCPDYWLDWLKEEAVSDG